MQTRCLVALSCAMMACLLLLLFADALASRFNIRQRERAQPCPGALCPTIKTRKNDCTPKRFKLDAYPVDDDCRYHCRDDVNALWACLADDRDYLWLVFNGDSIIRQIFLDVIGIVTGDTPEDIRELDDQCNERRTVLDHEKCVEFDLWYRRMRVRSSRAVEKRVDFRITYVAKHEVNDSIWEDSLLATSVGAPHLLAVDSALWDILYARNFTAYRTALPGVLKRVARAGASSSKRGNDDRTRLMWLAAPTLDMANMPEWKVPILNNVAVREYNAAARRSVRAHNEALDNGTQAIAWLDVHAVTDIARTPAWRGEVADYELIDQERLLRTHDGIHRPGVVSKTLTQLMFELACHSKCV